MKTTFRPRTRRASIRTRVLAIAFVPSIALLVAGLALAGYLVSQAVDARSFISKVHDSAGPGAQFFAAVRAERQLTLTDLTTHGTVHPRLVQTRPKTDATAAQMATLLNNLYRQAPARVQTSITRTAQNVAQLPSFRAQVDAGTATPLQAYTFYNAIIDEYTDGLNGVAEGAPDAQTAYLRVTAMPLFVAADQMARGDALAAAGLASGGLTDDEFRTYVGVVGAYHAGLDAQAPEMIPAVRAQYDALRASPAWATLTTVENSILNGDRTSLPVAQQQWRDSATQVAGTLVNLYIQQSSNATTVEIDTGNRMLVTSIVAGAAAILLAIIVSIIAWRLSSRLIRRLGRLRAETLEIADTQLPDLVSRVRSGQDVDLVTEMSFLDHGEDEIGQVADAFNKAQQTAVAAAVDEAKTREGTSKVFLNIAHRSQVLVHRQLKALDEAERKQEDPDQLDLLFKLDHLSTRARRNAENLIILGGERPGRQWRNPVALADLIRGATGETEDYTRVKVGKMPELAVNGPAVGDLIHLLAELLDNATSFSPPTSRVEIWAEVVGRGVVIEVEDQGVGIEQEQADELNATLKNPPDFSVMALSVEPRLGLFVVAQLAARHGITVTLRESAYGGTRAIVLVRSELLSPVPQPEEPLEILPAVPVPAQQGVSTRHPSLPLPLPQPSMEDATQHIDVLADAATQVDLFRPQHRPSRPQLSQSSGPLSADRPQLPRRRRQQNLAPQLQANESLVEDVADPVDDPHQARSRLAAFQQGTRRAREQDPAAADFLGEHSS